MPGTEMEQTINDNLPGKTRIISLSGEFSEDHKRVCIHLKMSDLFDHPNIYLALIDPVGNEISSSVILGAFLPEVNFNLHLGKYSAELPVNVSARIINSRDELIDAKVEIVR